METRLFILVMGAFWLLAQISSAEVYDDALPTDLLSPHGQSDVVFLLDGSDDVKKNNFELMKWYVKYLLSKVEVDGGNVRVGVATFSNNTIVRFNLTDYSTNGDVYKAIDGIPYQKGYSNTYSALNAMRTKMFTTENGDRTDVKNICILLTDGPSNLQTSKTIPEAKEAHKYSIHIYAIGIGVNNRSELDAVASPSEVAGETNSFAVKNFAVLETFRENVAASTTVVVTTKESQTTTTTETTTTALMTTTPRPSTQPTTTKPYACLGGKFGRDCTKTCRCSNKSEVCDKFTGRCVSGCLAGWKASDCQLRDCSNVAYCGLHTCVELRHDYSCSCLDGYENSDSHHCEDIDECEQSDTCGIHTCRNTEGSYECICLNASYENMHQTLCALRFDIQPENMEEDIVLEIKVRVIIETLHSLVIIFLALMAVLCARTVAIALWRFYTTEGYRRRLIFPPIMRGVYHPVIEIYYASIDSTVRKGESHNFEQDQEIDERDYQEMNANEISHSDVSVIKGRGSSIAKNARSSFDTVCFSSED